MLSLLPPANSITEHSFRPLSGLRYSLSGQDAQLQPAGPAWYGSVMGTGIVSTLLMLHGFPLIAAGFMVLGWVLLTGLTLGLLLNLVRLPGFGIKLLTDPASFTAWGMFAMGFLASGTPFALVFPVLFPHHAEVGWAFSWAMWIIGTLLGIATAFGFTFMAVRKDIGAPLPAWCLPVVPVTISATAGAALAGHSTNPSIKTLMVLASFGSLVMALTVSTGIIIAVYHSIWFRKPLPHALAATSFIPLGIVGQSIAAAQAIGAQALDVTAVSSHPAVLATAYWYGITVTTLGTPLFIWAAYTSYRAFARGLPFSPTWWALTFPVGVCSLGAYNMGWQPLSATLLMVLLIHWTVAAWGTLAALKHRNRAD